MNRRETGKMSPTCERSPLESLLVEDHPAFTLVPRREIALAHRLYREFGSVVAEAVATHSKTQLNKAIDAISFRLLGSQLHAEVIKGKLAILAGTWHIPE